MSNPSTDWDPIDGPPEEVNGEEEGEGEDSQEITYSLDLRPKPKTIAELFGSNYKEIGHQREGGGAEEISASPSPSRIERMRPNSDHIDSIVKIKSLSSSSSSPIAAASVGGADTAYHKYGHLSHDVPASTKVEIQQQQQQQQDEFTVFSQEQGQDHPEQEQEQHESKAVQPVSVIISPSPVAMATAAVTVEAQEEPLSVSVPVPVSVSTKKNSKWGVVKLLAGVSDSSDNNACVEITQEERKEVRTIAPTTAVTTTGVSEIGAGEGAGADEGFRVTREKPQPSTMRTSSAAAAPIPVPVSVPIPAPVHVPRIEHQSIGVYNEEEEEEEAPMPTLSISYFNPESTVEDIFASANPTLQAIHIKTNKEAQKQKIEKQSVDIAYSSREPSLLATSYESPVKGERGEEQNVVSLMAAAAAAGAGAVVTARTKAEEELSALSAASLAVSFSRSNSNNNGNRTPLPASSSSSPRNSNNLTTISTSTSTSTSKSTVVLAVLVREQAERIAMLEVAAVSRQEVVDKYQSEVQELEILIETLRTERSDLQSELTKLRSCELSDTLAKDTNRAQQTSIQVAQQINNSLQHQIDDSLFEFKGAVDRIQRLEAENNQLRSELREVKVNLSNAMYDLSVLRVQVQEQDEDKCKLTQQVSALIISEHDAQMQCSQTVIDLQGYESRLSVLDSEKRQLVNKLKLTSQEVCMCVCICVFFCVMLDVCYAMLCYAMLCYAMLCYAMLSCLCNNPSLSSPPLFFPLSVE